MKIENKEELVEKVQEFYVIDAESKALGKELTPLKNAIKTFMVGNTIDSVEVNGITVKLTEAASRDMNKDKLFDILDEKIAAANTEEESEALANCISYVKVIDEDALETAMFNGLISEKDLSPAMVTKYSTRMSIHKEKPKKPK